LSWEGILGRIDGLGKRREEEKRRIELGWEERRKRRGMN
jgi:hypothetical protein